jgi:hypothetical protein
VRSLFVSALTRSVGRESAAAICHTMLRVEKLERQDRKLNMGGRIW